MYKKLILTFSILIIFTSSFAVNAFTKIDCSIKWGRGFNKVYLPEEGFLAPDQFTLNVKGNFVISDPAENSIKLVDNTGKILGGFNEKEVKYWVPLRLTANKNGDVYIYTSSNIYVLDPSLRKLKKKMSHNLAINSITIDNQNNQYIFENYYEGSAKIIKIDSIGKKTIFADIGSSTSYQTDIFFKADEGLLSLVKQEDNTIDLSYYSLDGKKIRDEKFHCGISGQFIGYYEQKYVFLNPEEFKIYIVSKTRIQEINLLKIFSQRNISMNDILSNSNGPIYSIKFSSDKNAIALVSTKTELRIFNFKL